MTDSDHPLTALLDDAVPEPELGVDLDRVHALASRRHARMHARLRTAARLRTGEPRPSRSGRAALAAVAAAVVVVIAGGTYALTRPDNLGPVGTERHPRPASGHGRAHLTPLDVSIRPADLIGAWRLLRIENAADGSSAPASASWTLTFDRGVLLDDTDGSEPIRITPGHIVTTGPLVNLGVARHRPELDTAQSQLVGALVTGHLNWSVTNDTLRVGKPAVGTLVLRREGPSLPGAATITGTIVGSGGPPPTDGTAKPMPVRGIGTVTLNDVRTGSVHSVRTSANGSWTTLVEPGRYTVTATSPGYESGAGTCSADGPVTARAGHPMHVQVLCQLR